MGDLLGREEPAGTKLGGLMGSSRPSEPLVAFDPFALNRLLASLRLRVQPTIRGHSAGAEASFTQSIGSGPFAESRLYNTHRVRQALEPNVHSGKLGRSFDSTHCLDLGLARIALSFERGTRLAWVLRTL